MTSGHPRVNCCVPACLRGTTRIEPLPSGFYSLDTLTEEEQWICGTHWRLVPKHVKRRRTRLVAEWRKMTRRLGTVSFWELRPGSPERLRLLQVQRLIRASWIMCVKRASRRPEVEGEDLESELKRMGLL